MLRNANRPDIIVIDPRTTETASCATQHLQLKPKSDLPLLYAITQQLIEQDFVDYGFVQRHTTGFEQLAAHVAAFTPEAVAETTGIAAEVIRATAETIGSASAASLWWTTGIDEVYDGTRRTRKQSSTLR